MVPQQTICCSQCILLDWAVNLDTRTTQFGPPDKKINMTVMDRNFLGRPVQRDILVHRGFNNEVFSDRFYENLTAVVDPLLMDPTYNNELFFAGHSLGGANAQLVGTYYAHFHPNIAVSVTTIGQPRVGNLGFKVFAEEYLQNLNVWRLVNQFDLVPRAPAFNYDHAGHLMWLRENNTTEAYYLQTGNRSLGFRGISDFTLSCKCSSECAEQRFARSDAYTLNSS